MEFTLYLIILFLFPADSELLKYINKTLMSSET